MATNDPAPPSEERPDADEYIDRAIECHQEGDLAGALAACNEALKLNPDSASAYVIRSVVRKRQGYQERADADFTRALQIDPRDGTPYLLRGQFHAAQGQVEHARQDFDQAIQLEPHNPRGYAYRAQARAVLGDIPGALADCNRALEIDPASADALLARAAARWGQGDLETALADCEEAIRLAPDNRMAYLLRGNIHRSQGNAGAADEDYRQAEELEPGDADLRAPAAGQAKPASRGGALAVPTDESEGHGDRSLPAGVFHPAAPSAWRRAGAWIYPGVFHGAVAGALYAFLSEGFAAAVALLLFTPFFLAVLLRGYLRVQQAVLGGLVLAAACILLFLVRQPDVARPLAQVVAAGQRPWLNLIWWVLTWGVFGGLLFLFGGAIHLGLMVAYLQGGLGRAVHRTQKGTGAGLLLGAVLAGLFWLDVAGALVGAVVGAIAGVFLGMAAGRLRSAVLLALLGGWLGFESGRLDLEAVYRVVGAGLTAAIYWAVAGALVGVFTGSSVGSRAPGRVTSGPLFKRLVGQIPLPAGQGSQIATAVMTALGGLFMGASVGLVSGGIFGGLAVAGEVVGPLDEGGIRAWAIGGAVLGAIFAFLFTSRRASREESLIIPGRVSRGAPLAGLALMGALLAAAILGAGSAGLVWLLKGSLGSMLYWIVAGAVTGGMIAARLWSVVEK